MNYAAGRKYRDTRTGDIWILKVYPDGTPYVWNAELGVGLWDNGKYLKPIDDANK
jgi:hypothetical protein